MIRGLKHFTDYFEDFRDQYIVIGGTATYLNLESTPTTARATKDLDIVINVEALTEDFVKRFWNYIEEGGYSHKNGDSRNQFYIFTKPQNQDFPLMIEILSRRTGMLSEVDVSGSIGRLSIEEESISLSAILLDENYYDFIKEHVKPVVNLNIVTIECLIPLKTRAYNDLFEKRENGENVKSRDIKKHKNDVFRLAQELEPNVRIECSSKIYDDLKKFISRMEKEDIDLRTLNLSGNKEEVLELLNEVYILKSDN